MRPLLTANVPLPRKTDPGAALLALHEGLIAAGQAPRLSFHISHDVERVLERLVQAAPLLAPFWRGQLVADTVPGAPPVPAPDDLLPQLALVAQGIARRFQVRVFHVGFHELDLGEGWVAGLPVDPQAAAIFSAVEGAALLGPAPTLDTHLAYRNSWWVSGRQQSLSAMLLGAPLAHEAPAPTVPDLVLEVLGRVKVVKASRFHRHALPDGPADLPAASQEAPEDTARTARRIRVAALERMAERVGSGALPHDLSGLTASVAPPDVPAGLDRKGALSAALGPAGWRHQGKLGGPGALVFAKATRSNTRLQLHLDFGTWSQRFEARLEAKGATWSQGLPVQFHGGGTLVPTTPEVLTCAAENLAAVAADLEETWVAGLEALLGPSPGWTGVS